MDIIFLEMMLDIFVQYVPNINGIFGSVNRLSRALFPAAPYRSSPSHCLRSSSQPALTCLVIMKNPGQAITISCVLLVITPLGWHYYGPLPRSQQPDNDANNIIAISQQIMDFISAWSSLVCTGYCASTLQYCGSSPPCSFKFSIRSDNFVDLPRALKHRQGLYE